MDCTRSVMEAMNREIDSVLASLLTGSKLARIDEPELKAFSERYKD